MRASGYPEGIADDELVSLAALVALIASNVAVPYSPVVYASDASNTAGAFVKTKPAKDVVRPLWLGSDKKGKYTMLDNPYASILKTLVKKKMMMMMMMLMMMLHLRRKAGIQGLALCSAPPLL